MKRTIIIPLLALALLAGLWAVNEGSGTTIAAGKDFNNIPKHYDVKVFIDSKDNQVVFPNGMGRPFIAEGRTFTPYRIMCENLKNIFRKYRCGYVSRDIFDL